MTTIGAISGRRARRIARGWAAQGCAALAIAALLTAAAPARAQGEAAKEPSLNWDAVEGVAETWRAACGSVEAPELATRRQAAQACAEAFEAKLGFQDPRLVPVYLRIAETIAAGEGAIAARAALPFRRRAYRMARRLHGDGSPVTGETALGYAQALILAGRCSEYDRQIYTLLEAATGGFDGAPADSAPRREGYRRAARAYADALEYQRAVDTLLAAVAEPKRALTAQDWESVGRWRDRLGALREAADAYETALALETDPKSQERIRQSLRKSLYAAGALDKLREISE